MQELVADAAFARADVLSEFVLLALGYLAMDDLKCVPLTWPW